MGTTLENGVYLPSEGERNCYAGLKTNWEILDQKVADVTALQQAVAGALHREIVESLPTTDIDPNTIYMILSGTSATENVYNEFMYVNNAWELIGTSATDLTNYYTKAEVDGKLLLKANDADVVHKSGDETVSGFKQFANIRATNSIKAINLDSTTTDLNNCYSDFIPYGENKGGNIQYYYCNTDSGVANISNLPEAKAFFLTSITTRLISNSLYVKQVLINSNSKTFVRYCNNSTWSSWVNETDSEYVHKSGDETVGGNKTFNGNTNCVGELNQTAPFKMTADTSFVTGSKNTSIYDQNGFQCSNELIIYNNVKNIRRAWTVYNNSSGTTVTAGFNFILSASGQKVFYPLSDNDTDNGSSSAYWKNTYTKRINTLEPSSLSLPSGNASDFIDISSYLSVLDGSNANTYVAPANGWISITMSNCSGIQAYIIGLWGHQIARPTVGGVRFFMPVLKNNTINILIFGGTIDYARFIPCQGNV